MLHLLGQSRLRARHVHFSFAGAFAAITGLLLASPALADGIVVQHSSGSSGRGIYVDLEQGQYYDGRYGLRSPHVRIYDPGTTIRVVPRSSSYYYDGGSRVILDSTLVEPVIIDSTIVDSTLINPVIINGDRHSRYRYREPRRISIPMSSDLENCVELGNLQRACYRY